MPGALVMMKCSHMEILDKVCSCSCTYLQAHSVRVRYCLHASQLCRDLLIKHLSIIFLNFICAFKCHTYKQEYSPLWSLDKPGYWLNIFCFHSAQVFLSLVKFLACLILLNPSIYLISLLQICILKLCMNRTGKGKVYKTISC